MLLRVFEHIHGHLGWLSTLALFHPAILLRSARRRALLAAGIATGLVTLTGLLGALLYPAYRSLVKPEILHASPAIASAFERKEHLAVAVVVLAWVGLIAHWADCRQPAAPPKGAHVAFVAYSGAALLALLSAGLGLAVAAFRSF